MLSILGAALSDYLAGSDGVLVAYMPSGIPEAIPRAMVVGANKRVARTPAYAILVDSIPESSDPDCPRVTSGEAIAYRKDDRLAVVIDGRHLDIRSFNGVYREVLALDFPSAPKGLDEAALASLAGHALSRTLDAAGVVSTGWSRGPAIQQMTAAFVQLGLAYQQLAQGTESWNSYWFAHVDAGLTKLAASLHGKREAGSSESAADALQRLTFAAFSLPRPKDGCDFRKGRKFVEALYAYWSDAGTIEATAQQLRFHPESGDSGSGPHPFEALDWQSFGRKLAGRGNLLAAWAESGDADSETRIEAFASLTEDQFFEPHSGATSGLIEVLGVDGSSRGLAGHPTGPQLVAAEWQAEDGILRSEPLSMRLPLLGTPGAEEVDASSVSLSCRGATWHGVACLGDAELFLEGHLEVKMAKSAPKVPSRAFALQLEYEAEDTLVSYLTRSSTPPIYLVVDGTSGAYWFEHRKDGGLKSGSLSGYADLDKSTTDEPAAFVNSVPAGTTVSVVAWSRDHDVPARVGEAEFHPMAIDWMAEATFGAAGIDTVTVGNVEHEWQAPHSTGSFHSPLLAAMSHARVLPGPPPPATSRSLRGRVEAFYAENIGKSSMRHALGHIAVLDDEAGVESLVLSSNQTLLTPEHLRDAWPAMTMFDVPIAVAACPEAKEFREAFDDMGFDSALIEELSDGSEDFRWPSKTSWRQHWVQNGRLGRYLQAYVDLMEVARASKNPAAAFWAAYPFSVSVWRRGAGQGARAVLLSPLHPLRLAWLAATEHSLWEADDPKLLSGIVEGWNLPLLGPQAFPQGRMIAVPIDNGDGQLFAGWSMLVNVSVAGASPLNPPATVAGLPAPGTAASGLNASSVSSAVRTYRRINPHVTSLSIDLAAGGETPRLEEIDEAVLAAIVEWRKENRGRSQGGIRVRDSLNRLGEIPRAALDAILLEQDGLPVMWTRYSPRAGAMSSNLRFLQDAGLGVVVAPGGMPNCGLVADAPLRRFEGPAIMGTWNNASVSRPALRPDVGWTPYGDALRLLEEAEATPQVEVQLFQAQMLSQAAEWTVCGESMISPGAMAQLLGGAAGSQMLWEWRPPFLDAANDAQLERRPFVSVVRVPEAFRSQVGNMLQKANPEAAGGIGVDQLLGALGSRGVGLSSLMAMGGTHASGALGFFLGFQLMDQVADPDAEFLVMPIDACDTFLRSLAGTGEKHDSLRRADLLVMRVAEGRITFIPIEIKFYGFQAGNPVAQLPSPGSAALNEPVDQLAHTTRLLQSIKSRFERMRGASPDAWRGLWLQGLATLVESASRLHVRPEANTDLVGQVLHATLKGEIHLEVGRPLLCYFGHEATAAGGTGFVGFTDSIQPGHEELGGVGGIVANTSATFEAVAEPDELVRRWVEVVRWAAQPAGASSDREWGGEEDQQFGPFGVERRTPATPSVPRSEEPIPAAPTTWNDEVPEASDDVAGEDLISGDGVRFAVGRSLTSLGAHEVEFWPSNTRLNQMNVGVVGDLGTGKTQLLKALTYQLRAESERTQPTPLSMLIFDYKRDFQDADFLARVGGRVLQPFHIPLNIFALANYTPLAAWQRASNFLDVLAKIYPGIGPVQANRLKTVIVDVYKERDGKPPTLAMVLDRYREAAGTEDAITGILSTFVMGEIFSDDPDGLIPFEELISDRVLVVALSELGADQRLKNALVVLFLNQYYEYMLQRQKWPFQGEDPQLRRLNSMLLVDEATNIMKYEFPVLMDLMLQGREFGVGVILSSQYLSHFKAGGTNYGQPLLTWFIHKVPNVTAKELRTLGLTSASDDMAQRISDLGVHEALCVTLDTPGEFVRGTPFYKLLQ